jgi:hypothetical protein
VKKLIVCFKKLIVKYVVIILLFNLILIRQPGITLLSPVQALRYSPDANISKVDASFIGEGPDNLLGWPISICGDVNGDGFDDILVGAQNNSDGGYRAGKVYLIFGKKSNWSMDINISSADASFVGENSEDGLGWDGCGVGDINGDGFDDIAITSGGNDEGGYNAGQLYLIFGKATGWVPDTNISNSSASFIGEVAYGMLGWAVSDAGDVNADGFDDLMVSSVVNGEKYLGGGQVYLIFGKATGWSMDRNITEANASFLGEGTDDYLGWSLASVGDVNGDGFDDILISAAANDDSFWQGGQVYLIFGKASGWSMDTDIDKADASFTGEMTEDYAGIYISGAGDINADGYDDFLIGSASNSESGFNAGQTYIIFGKSSGWSMATSLSKADASFRGENDEDKSGLIVRGAGDVNGDGYGDILIGASDNDEGAKNAGQVYLILGKDYGWSMDMNISDVDASFLGENAGDKLGWPCDGGGDINGDGYDDILLGSMKNTQVGFDSGKAYLIFPELNYLPNNVYTVKAYSDGSYSNEIFRGDLGGWVFIELSGSDGNSSRNDSAFVQITSRDSSPEGIRLSLEETSVSSGIYRGSFKIANRSNDALKSIQAALDENITITSSQDPTKFASLFVSTPVQLRPTVDKVTAIEDEEYYAKYGTYGYNTVTTWEFATNASWLVWDSNEHIINGTPNNNDIGHFWVRLTISDDFGNYDEHNFTIEVQNTIPKILTMDVEVALEDKLYYVDYESDDEGLGGCVWNLNSNAQWLELNSTTGVLNGTPRNADVGDYWVNVSIDDGHGGENNTNFTLSVHDSNDAPIIITNGINSTYEDSLYIVDFDAIDIDDTAIFDWDLTTNGSWLNMNRTTGVLSGIPNNSNVGICFVNVTVKDVRSGKNHLNFSLEVLNVNDPPVWLDTPSDATVKEGKLFNFDVNANDVDVGDILTFNISSWPESNISIDSKTGLIEWYADIEDVDGDYLTYQITLQVSDNVETIKTNFDLTVILNSLPTSNLLSPLDEEIVKADNISLFWQGFDIENESLTYDVYLSSDLQSVINLLEISRVLYNHNLASHILSGLEPGRIYYWTVIPNDGNSYGSCQNGIFRFTVNTPPIIPDIPLLKATVGSRFTYDISASDHESITEASLDYILTNSPMGMTIDPTSGVITWIPTKDQIGKSTVELSVTDGIDFTNKTFQIEVLEKNNEDKFGFAFTLLLIIIFVIIILIIIFLIFRRRSKSRSTNGYDPRAPRPDDKQNEISKPQLEPEDNNSNSIDYKSQVILKSNITTSSPSTPQSLAPSLSPSIPSLIEIPILSDSHLPAFPSKLVGRNDELNELQSILIGVTRRNGGTVLLSGETGIGKTSMVKELKSMAESQGIQFLSGYCHQESQTPFYPIFEALRHNELASLFMDEPPKIEAMILMTHGGTIIEKVIRDETKFDLELFSSILATVGDFLKESLSRLTGADRGGVLNTLRYKNYQILIERGDHSNLAVILTGRENEFLIEEIKDVHQKTNDINFKTSKNLDDTREQTDKNQNKGIFDLLHSLIVSGKYDGSLTKLDDPRLRRNLLFKNVSMGLAQQAEDVPILLCIEDLQWADPSSLALMHYISRSAKRNRILIVGTYRSEEVTAKDEKTHPFMETMQLMDIEGLYKSVELNRLPEEYTKDFLLAQLDDVEFDEKFIHRFYQETAGNPLFMTELLKYLIEYRIIAQENGIWKMVKKLDDVKIPKQIYNVILRRLERLDKDDRRVLDFASVIGELFTSQLLSKALNIERVRLLDQLRVLEQTHKLIYPQNGNYKFDHSKIKEVLYNELSEVERIKVHSIIAGALEDLNKESLEEVIEALAFHYYNCKNKDKALHYLLQAAERAKLEYSLDEAITFYSRALELEKDHAKRREILNGLKIVYDLKGKIKNNNT